MKMQMAGQTGAGASAEINAYIKALRIKSFGECLLCLEQSLHKLKHFSLAQLDQIRLVQMRGNEQMAIGVREAVHTDQNRLAPPEDEVLRIFRGSPDVATKETIVRITQAGNVFHPPRSPKVFEHGFDFQ